MPQLVGVVWWPHSGGRWFCRSLIGQHTQVMEATFVHPWEFFSTDMTLELDITAQVHKARSMPDLKEHLAALKESVDAGRIAGLKHYFDHIKREYKQDGASPSHILGEMCLGSPIPRAIDLDAIFKAQPDFKIIHLVRSPLESFLSFSVRHEMDSDPIKIAGSWLTLNAHVRTFFEDHPEFADQCLTLKYEDLMTDLEGEVKRVCAFIDIPFYSELVTKQEQRWGRNTSTDVPQPIQDKMKAVAASELLRYGY
ncbi:MAG: sulfotransferase [Bacteroidia bacterium]|nr:sulfotransferase [Bacteroidia bacterium]